MVFPDGAGFNPAHRVARTSSDLRYLRAPPKTLKPEIRLARHTESASMGGAVHSDLA